MPSTDQTVQVTLHLPKVLYQQASATAEGEQQQVEDLLSQLMIQTLQNLGSYQLWQSVSNQYRARLAQENRLDQSPHEILSQLRTIREEIAHELYPE